MWVPQNESQVGGSSCGFHSTSHTRLSHAGGSSCRCREMIHMLLSYALGQGCEFRETTHKNVTNRLGANIGVDKAVICMYRVSKKQWRSMSAVSFKRI